MADKIFEPKLIIIDCDGVLYSPSELNVNAMFYAFNDVCDDFALKDAKFNFLEDCTRDKPIKGFYNYLNYIAQKVGIKADDFVLKMSNHVDYSHLKADKDGVLAKLRELKNKYRICICTNNHLIHLNKILKAKFNILSHQLPFEVFDTRYAEQDEIFYPKDSAIFVAKLEKHFGIKACDFLWIDDNPNITDKIKDFGSQAKLVTAENRLIDILNSL